MGDKLKSFKASGKKKKGEEDDIDIFTVTDINDVGNGAPLFEHFTFEDWELAKLRFEFAMLIWSFKKDTDDPDRNSIPMDHLSFYYSKYYEKQYKPQSYGVTEVKEMLHFIKDTVSIKDKVLAV